jgi:hypothetical protein
MPFLAALLALIVLAGPVHADSILYTDLEKNYELELGDLDPLDSDPLLGSSPFFGARKFGSGSGKWFDWSFDSKLFVLDLNARYGPESPSASKTLVVGSVLGQVGRAYNLFGPVDVSWSAMGIMRTTGYFPNLSLDETVGARYRYAENHSMGFFTGLTQSAIEGGRTWTETLKEERTATHNALAFWGETGRGLGYNLELGRQENATTTVDSLSSRLTIPTRGDSFDLRARVEEETGDSIGFYRKRTSLGSEFRVGRDWDMGVNVGVDDIDFGGVEQKAKSLMLTFRYNPRRSKKNLRLRSTIVDRRTSTPPAGELPVARKVYDAVQRLDALLARLQRELDAVDPAEAAQSLADALDDLPPRLRDALDEEVGDIDADRIAELVDRAQAGTAEAREELARIASVVGDADLIERLAVRAARKELHAVVASQNVDILGRTVKLTPPQLIALAHAYNLSNEPLPPITDRDIDNWISDECGGALKDCLLSRLPSQLRPAADAAWGDSATLEDSVRWAADLARREMNRLLLDVMLAAERLDGLTVGEGRRPGELNRDRIYSSYASLDRRRASGLASVFKRARALLSS